MRNVSILCLIFLTNFAVLGQDCEVSLPYLSEYEYDGECKKGKAHGNGMLKTENFVYSGEFKKGLPSKKGTITKSDTIVLDVEIKDGEVYGFGKLSYSDKQVKEGFWKGDLDKFRFVGDSKEDLLGYKILQKDNLDNAQVSFSKSKNNSNYLTIMLADPSNRSLSGIRVNERSSGQVVANTSTASRVQIEINNMQFPYVMTMNYTVAANQGTNSNVFVVYRFEITEPGDWILRITH